MRFLRLAFLILLTLVLFACAATPTPAETGGSETRSPAETEPTPASSVKSRELIVFAAASLTEAFGEIGTLFESQNPGTTVTFNFAGSNQLAQQIGQGAPADVFASANAVQMGVAIESGRVITGTQQTFVRNRLVVITPADNPGDVTTLQDLTKPGLKIVFAADAVPVGQYSVEFLEKASADSGFTADYKDAVLANVVSYEENVRSVLSKVVLGEADAGIVYTSDITQNSREQVAQIEIPDVLNVIASYPIAPVADSANSELAAEFIALVLSPEGQAILTRYGFIGVADAATFMPVALEGRKQ
jgi:molybdate transport system substrate-binding protein